VEDVGAVVRAWHLTVGVLPLAVSKDELPDRISVSYGRLIARDIKVRKKNTRYPLAYVGRRFMAALRLRPGDVLIEEWCPAEALVKIAKIRRKGSVEPGEFIAEMEGFIKRGSRLPIIDPLKLKDIWTRGQGAERDGTDDGGA